MAMKPLFMMKMFGGRGRMEPITTGPIGRAGIQVVVTVVTVIMVVGADGEEVDHGVKDMVEVVVPMVVAVGDNLAVRLELEVEDLAVAEQQEVEWVEEHQEEEWEEVVVEVVVAVDEVEAVADMVGAKKSK
jgi:hypothetical protein